jgi:hypothetical protein
MHRSGLADMDRGDVVGIDLRPAGVLTISQRIERARSNHARAQVLVKPGPQMRPKAQESRILAISSPGECNNRVAKAFKSI